MGIDQAEIRTLRFALYFLKGLEVQTGTVTASTVIMLKELTKYGMKNEVRLDHDARWSANFHNLWLSKLQPHRATPQAGIEHVLWHQASVNLSGNPEAKRGAWKLLAMKVLKYSCEW